MYTTKTTRNKEQTKHFKTIDEVIEYYRNTLGKPNV